MGGEGVARADEPSDHDITTEFNEAAIAGGVPAPSVRRGLDGAVTVPIVGIPLRVFGWVELDPPDPTFDPAIVGSTSGDDPSGRFRRRPASAPVVLGSRRHRHDGTS